RLAVALEAVAAAMSMGDGFGDLQERTACMRERASLAMDQAQLAVDAQFLHGNAHQVAAGNFVFHADFGQECDTVSQCDKAFNRLQSGQFDPHVQGWLVFFECLDHLFSVGSWGDVWHVRLSPQLPDTHTTFARDRMPWWNN